MKIKESFHKMFLEDSLVKAHSKFEKTCILFTVNLTSLDNSTMTFKKPQSSVSVPASKSVTIVDLKDLNAPSERLVE